MAFAGIFDELRMLCTFSKDAVCVFLIGRISRNIVGAKKTIIMEKSPNEFQ
jgi:hypothetical protein